MFVGTLMLAVLAFTPVVLADGYLNGLLQALNTSCLDQFANATAYLNSTASGQLVLVQLSQGNKTIFAPTDDACVLLSKDQSFILLTAFSVSGMDPAIINNETALADIISYHIVSGNFINQTQAYPNVTIGRTLLNDSALVMLEGNHSQVLIWSKFDNGSLFVINQE